MEEKKVTPNPKALFPIGLFLVLYLGNGIYFEYISPREGQMGLHFFRTESSALMIRFIYAPRVLVMTT